MSGEKRDIIIVKRIKKHAHAHHGGAWKVAYADFVTAMMAFFLLMWLMGSTTHEERAAISDFFTKPSLIDGASPVPSSHPTPIQGPGGASTSMIDMGGALDLKTERERPKPVKVEQPDETQPAQAVDAGTAEQVAREQERKRLEQLQADLHAAIRASQALAPFKDQLLIDLTPEGLRVQIVDAESRPMFDRGSMQLKGYSAGILAEIAKIVNEVPNKISISGHTDAAPYIGRPDYGNWELSTDRANAARRALVFGGMIEDKVARVVGLSSAVPFDKRDPFAAINRRISIIVMNRDMEAPISGVADVVPPPVFP